MTPRRRPRASLFGLLCLAFGLAGSPAWPDAAEAATAAAVRPGPLLVEPPTPQALAFRWTIGGDDNGNASVAVRYRLAGSETWRKGLGLMRVGLESRQPKRRIRPDVVMAGSLVGLRADSRYEVRLELTDPDGGGRLRALTLRTAAEPSLPGDLRRRRVVPRSDDLPSPGRGTAEAPFNGLRAAAEAAQPGDLLLLAPGRYLGEGLRWPTSGDPGRPIVLQGDGQGAAILDGGGEALLLDLSGRHHVWVRRLELSNAETLILADRAQDLLVQGNRLHVSRAGYVAKGAVGGESVGHFVLDNRFLGPTLWPRSKGIEHIFGIGLSGSGHVIAYNRMENLGDCIRGAWVDGGDGLLSASDIHHNDLQSCTDDGIEVDHADANVRVFGNRITNSFAAISLQPIFGGPVYLYRNLIHNTLYSPFKLHNNTSGVVMIHNTSVRAGIPFFIRTSTESVRDSMTRNNLFVGTEGPAIVSTATMIGSDFDADGYIWQEGDFGVWNGKTYGTPAEAKAEGAVYGRIGALRLALPGLFDPELAPIDDEERRYGSRDNAPRLAAESLAIDRGVPMPTFNDDFEGDGPDLGCCEQGVGLPAVGPRPPFAD